MVCVSLSAAATAPATTPATTPKHAYTIAIVSANPPLTLSVAWTVKYSEEYLTDKNCDLWSKHVKENAEDVLRQRQKSVSVVDNLVVYVRDNEESWYSVDLFNDLQSGTRPLIQGSKTKAYPEFLLTDRDVSRKHTRGCCCSHRLLFGCRWIQATVMISERIEPLWKAYKDPIFNDQHTEVLTKAITAAGKA
eukprot:GHVU01137933.1.p1 GENE.GHVU01137933.1~~GHVU01137933.1.p1  ORF type:complete len:192 (+),score=5.96 GHVU01137933.1:82-657(+)